MQLDTAPLREMLSQKRSGTACVLKGPHSYTCTPTDPSAIALSHWLHSYSWYSFTSPGGMED